MGEMKEMLQRDKGSAAVELKENSKGFLIRVSSVMTG